MHRILIANRAEVACRVARTARDMGYRTVAVYSDADVDATHVRAADEAVRLGPAGLAESYLCAERLLKAAARTGCDAVHPGYGFLSEDADFARRCEAAGLRFIGPSAEAIALMGDKRRAKQAAEAVGVAGVPGYHGEAQDDGALLARAAEIGFPLMIKAAAGGGGRGIRTVDAPSALPEALRAARGEAEHAFGAGGLILERALVAARHIEVQVFADRHGAVVHMGERDCSVQRRHQKIVEEAPSPFVDPALRERMGEAAVRVARGCGYIGAGTVEFLVDSERRFHFLEMNTRLQVEHPVTECVSGQDLVAWQLRVAEGEPLPLEQSQLRIEGHAVEARLYAEDPRAGFAPQTGRLRHWSAPARAGVRVDSGVAAGQVVSAHYDPMLCKLIAHAATRGEAVRRLASAVQDLELLGVNSNKHFLCRLLRDPVFAAGEATTEFVRQRGAALRGAPGPSKAALARAALAFSHRRRSRDAAAWRVSAGRALGMRIACAGREDDVQLLLGTDGCDVEIDGWRARMQWRREDAAGPAGARCATVVEDGVLRRVRFALDDGVLLLDDGDGHYAFEDRTHRPATKASDAAGGRLTAAMDGAVVSVRVAVGDRIEAGQVAAVIESMKMEHPVVAAAAGAVAEVRVAPGEQVSAGALLVRVDVDGAERTAAALPRRAAAKAP